MSDLIPSPTEVRCHIAEDLPTVLHCLLLQVETDFDPGRFVDAHLRMRDQLLIRRLQEVVPEEDLQVAFTGGDGLDISALSKRVPSVYSMWVMINSLVVERATETVAKNAGNGIQSDQHL